LITTRSKQWDTKTSRLASSLVNVSTDRPQVFLSSQQDHRTDDWSGQISNMFGWDFTNPSTVAAVAPVGAEEPFR
jgi:hypothetical protein